MGKIGFLTMAFGPDKYIKQATNLAISLNLHMPDIPIAIVTDRENPGSIFDVTVPMKPYKVAGTILKTDIYEYSPFEETLFIDSDCMVARPFWEELSDIRKYDFTPVVSRYLVRGETDLWIDDLPAALDFVQGNSLPKFNGGVYFFRKGASAAEIFKQAKSLRTEIKPFRIKNFDKAGPGEETLFGLALARLGVPKLYNDGGRLMQTPLKINGKLKIDVLGGGCSFIKKGLFVEPAICHFCGEWGTRPEYLIAEYTLRNRRSPSSMLAAKFWSQHYLKRIRTEIKNRTKLLSAMPRVILRGIWKHSTT